MDLNKEAPMMNPGQQVRPIEDLRPCGILWAINRHVFHPRGFALALHLEEDGTVTGWSLFGDGTEPWSFMDDEADHQAFRAFEGLIQGQVSREDHAA